MRICLLLFAARLLAVAHAQQPLQGRASYDHLPTPNYEGNPSYGADYRRQLEAAGALELQIEEARVRERIRLRVEAQKKREMLKRQRTHPASVSAPKRLSVSGNQAQLPPTDSVFLDNDGDFAGRCWIGFNRYTHIPCFRLAPGGVAEKTLGIKNGDHPVGVYVPGLKTRYKGYPAGVVPYEWYRQQGKPTIWRMLNTGSREPMTIYVQQDGGPIRKVTVKWGFEWR